MAATGMMSSLSEVSKSSIQGVRGRAPKRGFDTLSHASLFARLSQEDILRLNARCKWRTIAAGEYLLDERGDSDALSIVTSGRVRVVRMINGRQIILRDVNQGGYFGELCALEGGPGSTQILAVANAVVARMPSQVFRESIYRHQEVCHQFLIDLLDRIRTMDDRFAEQISLNARERLCLELLRLSRQTARDRIAISPPPSHFEIAARIGGCRETVTKLLIGLERDGLISRSRSAIALTDVAKLRTIVALGQL
jgi:CRP/FNR family transcriptional regulator, cyclic AMP receptor protein